MIETVTYDCNWTRTQNHLVLKRTLNQMASLAKWLGVRLRTKWFWVRVQLQKTSYFERLCLWYHLPQKGTTCLKLATEAQKQGVKNVQD